MTQVNVAKHSGFCFGVKKAFDMAIDASKTEKDVIMLGDIVHNEAVVQKIDEAGVKVIDTLENTNQNTTLLLRAHGVVPEVYAEAKKRNLKIKDATCPLVLEIHHIARELHEQGYRLIVIGDHNHDEVRGIAGQVEKSIVIAKPEEVHEKIPRRMKKVGVVVQSTQNIENAKSIVKELAGLCGEMKFIDTICGPTKAYQREIKIMPKENDVMIIVGSFTSANTCRLTEISKELNPNTYQVTSENDIKKDWFQNATSVGVHAGASTPDWVINSVVEKIQQIVQNPQTQFIHA